MMHSFVLDSLNEQIRIAGFTPSSGCWEDDSKAVAFSVESHGPATFGHPKFMLEFRKDTGMVLHENTPYAFQ